ncbi:hypothetical protein NUACC26_060770 [Scytonema sp. NUACC26]
MRVVVPLTGIIICDLLDTDTCISWLTNRVSVRTKIQSVTNNTRHYDRITQLHLENWFLA